MNPQQEIDDLFKQKGELITQLEVGQSKLQQVNLRLGQLLNIQPTPIQVPQNK